MDQDFSKFSEEIYYEEKPFHKNKEIQIKRMFSTSFQKPKSVDLLFSMINSTLLLNVFYRFNLEIWPFYEVFIKSDCCYAPIVILHFFEAT